MEPVLGRAVLDHVAAHRNQFDMGEWAYSVERDNPAGCGTVACLAGWALLLSGRYKLSGEDELTGPDGEVLPFHQVGETARVLLNLTDDELYGPDDEPATLFGHQPEDHAIERFRVLVEAAEEESPGAG